MLSEVSCLMGHDLAVLSRIPADPDITRARLADDLNISIGTVNARMNRLV